jgi:hypothetical protein
VTFEAGSHLRTIEDNAFHGCNSLIAICLLASVELVTPGSLSGGGLCPIEIEKDSLFLPCVGDYLLDADDTGIIWYFASAVEVEIADRIKSLDPFCFRSRCSIVCVNFLSSSQLCSIQCGAFLECENLGSIVIPVQVTTLGDECFAGCVRLASVLFLAACIRKLLRAYVSRRSRIGDGSWY